MADLTDDQLDDLARVARAGSPGPFQAAFSYRDPGNVLALLAAVRRGRRIEKAVREIAAEMIAERDRGSLSQSPDYNLGLEAIADEGERIMVALDA
jgi:hypothetical protein